jgi:hypothetical protein
VLAGKEKQHMAVKTKAEVLALVADTKTKVLALQEARNNAGMTAAEEAEVVAALEDLSITANPAVPNPPDTPPDPNLP